MVGTSIVNHCVVCIGVINAGVMDACVMGACVVDACPMDACVSVEIFDGRMKDQLIL